MREKGTQIAWESKYRGEHKVDAPVGLHIFNAGDSVTRVDGRVGHVDKRTALTADIRWHDDRSIETIEQFDERYMVT